MADQPVETPEVPETPKAPVAKEPKKPNYARPSYEEFRSFNKEQMNEYINTQATMGNTAAKTMQPAMQAAKRKDEEIGLRNILPTTSQRKLAYEKGLGQLGNQEAALDRLLAAQDVATSQEARQKKISSLVQGALSGTDPMRFDQDTFTALNVTAMTQIGKEYKDAKDMQENFRKDVNNFQRHQQLVQQESAKKKTKYRAVGVLGGQQVGVAEMTGTSFDQQQSEARKPSAEQVLFSDDTDPEMWQSVSGGLTGAPTDDEFLEFAFDNDADRDAYKSNAFRPQKDALAMDVYKPIFQDPTGKTKGIDLHVSERAARAYYVRKLTKNKPLSSFSEEERQKIVREAEENAKADISRIERHTHSYVYHRNDDAMEKFLEGKGVLGTISKIPLYGNLLKPAAALFLPHRKIAGEVYKRGEEGELVAEHGVIGTYLGDGGVARSVDSLFRYAPSEVVGAAFHLAHKDYVRQFGDKAKGRGAWIARRMVQVWDDDRLVQDIATTTDNAGRLLTEAGSVMMGEWGEKNPRLANTVLGVPAFGAMLLEPDIFWAGFLAAGYGGVVTKGFKGVKTLIKARHIDRVSDGLTLINKHVDALSDAERLNPVNLHNALKAAQKEDKSGTVKVILQRAGEDVGFGLSARYGEEGGVLKTRLGEIKAAAKNAADSEISAIKNAEKAKNATTQSEKTIAENQATIDSLTSIRNQVEAERANLRLANTALKRAESDLLSISAARSLVGDEAVGALRRGKPDQVRKALSEKKVEEYFAKRGVKVDDLRAELDELYPGGKLAQTAKARKARRALREKILKLVEKEATIPLSRRQKLANTRRAKAVAKQEKAAQALEALVKSAQDSVGGVLKARKLGEMAPGTKMGPLIKALAKEISENQRKILLAQDDIAEAAKSAELAKRVGARVGDEVVLGVESLAEQEATARAMLDTLRKMNAAIDVVKTRRGGEIVEDLVTRGEKSAVLAKDTKAVKELKALSADDLLDMSDQEFIGQMARADGLVRMWASPEVMNTAKTFSFMSLWGQPRVWMAAAEVHIADLVRRTGGFFTTRISLMGDRVSVGVNKIARRIGGLARAAEADLGLIYKHAPRGQAEALIQKYLSSSGVIQLGKGIEISGNVGLGGTFLSKATENFLGIARAIPKDEAAKAAFFEGQSSVALRAFVQAFVSDKIKATQLKLVDASIVRFLGALQKGSDEIMALSDPLQRLRAFQQLALDSLPQNIRVAGTLDEIPARSMGLSYRSVLGGAIEEMYTARVANLVGPGIGLRTVRAYDRFIGRGKELSSERVTLEVGDMVVFKSDVEDFRRVTKTSAKAEAKRTGVIPPLEARFAGAEAGRRIESFFTDTDGIVKVRLSGGDKVEIVPKADITLRDPELSFLDLADAYLVFGPDLVKQAYKKDAASAARTARDSFVELVVHSKDAAGNYRVLPKFKLEAFSKGLDNLGKKLTENISDSASINPLVRASLGAKDKMVSLWKRHVLTGFLVPNPAFFMNNIVGDFSQMAFQTSIPQAVGISLYGSVGYLPRVGTRLQDAMRGMNQKLGKLGVPQPSMFGAVFNRFVDDMLEGIDEVRVYKLADGRTIEINPAVAMREALEDGIDDSIRHTDWAQGLRESAQRNLPSVERALEATKPVRGAADEYFNIMDITMRAANRRQRGLLYWHSRFNKGMSRDDAMDLLHRSLYDYQMSVGRFETEWIAKHSAFYVFTKNAMIHTFNALFEGSDDLLGHARKYVRFNTSQQKIEAMIRFSDVLFSEQYVDPGRILSPAEQRRIARERGIPDWLMDYMLTDVGTLTPEGQKIMKELGAERLNFARTASTKLTSIEFTNMYADMVNIISGAAYAGLRSDVDFDSKAGSKRILEELIDMMNPITETATEDLLKRMLGLRTIPKSEYGDTLSAREIEFLGLFGLSDTFRIRKVNGKIRSKNALVRAGLVDMSARELDRMRLMGTIIFGPEAFGKDMAPADLRAYLAGQDKSAVQERLQALAQLLNVQRIYLYHGDQTAHWDLKEAKHNLRSRSRGAGKEGLVE